MWPTRFTLLNKICVHRQKKYHNGIHLSILLAIFELRKLMMIIIIISASKAILKFTVFYAFAPELRQMVLRLYDQLFFIISIVNLWIHFALFHAIAKVLKINTLICSYCKFSSIDHSYKFFVYEFISKLNDLVQHIWFRSHKKWNSLLIALNLHLNFDHH